MRTNQQALEPCPNHRAACNGPRSLANCLIRAGGGDFLAQLKVVSSIVLRWDERATSVVRANRAPGASEELAPENILAGTCALS